MVNVKRTFEVALADTKKLIGSRAETIGKLVPASAGEYRVVKQVEAFALECWKNPKLLECSPASILMAHYQAAILGLEIGSAYKHAYLVPFKGECQLIVGYHGLVLLMVRSGAAKDVSGRAIFEGDEWEWDEGDHPRLFHRPNKLRTGSSKLVAVYARARLPDNTYKFHLMLRDEVEEIRERSLKKSYNPDRSPWTTDPIPMAIKCPIRRLPNQLPIAMIEAAKPLLKAVAVDEGREYGMTDREAATMLGVPEADVPGDPDAQDATPDAPTLRTVVTGEAEPAKEAEIIDVEHDARVSLPSYDDGSAPADVTTGKATIAKYLNDKSYQKLAHGVVTAHREATKRALTEFTIEDVAAVLGEIRKAVRG